MCLCLTNPKLCSSEQSVVLNICKINEPRKQKFKVEILHDLKEFLKEFLKFNLFSITVKAEICFILKKQPPSQYGTKMSNCILKNIFI